MHKAEVIFYNQLVKLGSKKFSIILYSVWGLLNIVAVSLAICKLIYLPHLPAAFVWPAIVAIVLFMAFTSNASRNARMRLRDEEEANV